MPFPVMLLPLGAGLIGLFAAAVIDLRTRIIPDGLVLWVLGTGFLTRCLAEGWTGAAVSLLAAAGLFIPFAAMTHRGLIGGGDAKMIPAASLLVPVSAVLALLLAIALAGGVLAGLYYLVHAVRRRRPSAAQAQPAPLLPYGVAILAGVVFILSREVFPCLFATACSS